MRVGGVSPSGTAAVWRLSSPQGAGRLRRWSVTVGLGGHPCVPGAGWQLSGEKEARPPHPACPVGLGVGAGSRVVDLGLSPTQKDCCRGKRDAGSSVERKLKRRLDRDGLAGERWDRVKKTRTPRKKKIKLSHPKDTSDLKLERERGYESARSAESHSLPSDASYSEQEDSEDEDALCPAASCLQPEGDEVSAARAAEAAPPLSSASP